MLRTKDSPFSSKKRLVDDRVKQNNTRLLLLKANVVVAHTWSWSVSRRNICTWASSSSLLLSSSGAPWSSNMISFFLLYCRGYSESRVRIYRLLILSSMQTFQLLLRYNPLDASYPAVSLPSHSRSSRLFPSFSSSFSSFKIPSSSSSRSLRLDFLRRFGRSIYCSELSLRHRLPLVGLSPFSDTKTKSFFN